jgi:hypothetical protein
MANIYEDASWGGIGEELKQVGKSALGLNKASSNYTGSGPTDPDANGRNPNRAQSQSRVPVTQGDMNRYADARDKYDPLGVKANTRASDEGTAYLNSLYNKAQPQQASYSNEGRGVAPKAAPTPQPQGGYTPGGDDIEGAAGRINPNARSFTSPDPRQQEWLNKTGNAGYQSGGLEGKKVYNHYDPDRPASMGTGQNDPWKDMARQVANFSMLRAMDTTAPMTGSRAGDLATLQWRQRMLEQPGRDQSAQGLEMLRGQNQQQNTETQYGLIGRNQEATDDRNYTRSMDLEMLKLADPTKAAQAKLYESQGKAYDAHGGLYTAQAAAASRAAKANPYFETITKMMDAGLLNPKDPAHADLINKSIGALNQQFGGSGFEGNQQAAQIRAAFQAGKLSKEEARQQLAALNGTAKFADGGQVESSEQLMARMREKYGLSAPAAEAPAPVQRPAAPAPQPQQKPQTWAEKLRNVATGGLDRRMQGYAEGGPIDVSGRQVLGEGTPKSDSLPAIIDGQHPAALSTEEFVFPVETVRHFGLAKLNKMVEQSRKGLDTGRNSA